MTVMARVAVVHHNRELGVGRLAPFLDRHTVVDLWAPDEDFPDDVGAVVVMGGFMAAYETDLHPWLEGEKRWLAKRVGDDTPVLGICLGAQLLADATGGRAFRAPRPEVGVVPVELTEAGVRHPVASQLPGRAFFAHRDTFDLPSDAVLLAATEEYPSAFQIGSALAVQPHPETPVDEAIRWADHPAFDLLELAGVDREEYAADLREHSGEMEGASRRLFRAWFEGIDEG